MITLKDIPYNLNVCLFSPTNLNSVVVWDKLSLWRRDAITPGQIWRSCWQGKADTHDTNIYDNNQYPYFPYTSIDVDNITIVSTIIVAAVVNISTSRIFIPITQTSLNTLRNHLSTSIVYTSSILSSTGGVLYNLIHVHNICTVDALTPIMIIRKFIYLQHVPSSSPNFFPFFSQCHRLLCVLIMLIIIITNVCEIFLHVRDGISSPTTWHSI